MSFSRRLQVSSRIAVACCATLLLAAPVAATPPEYQLYLGGYPQQETDWSNDTQGVAHDDDHWFITQTVALWKIPVGANLGTVTATSPGVRRRGLNFWHW